MNNLSNKENSHNHLHNHIHCCCGCHPNGPQNDAMNRREFLATTGIVLGGLALASTTASSTAAENITVKPIRKPLKIQPVLTYDTPTRRNATSWRNWGGIQTEQQAAEEVKRITAELETLKKTANFPLQINPVIKAKNVNQAETVLTADCDVILIYAAGAWVNTLEKLASAKQWNLMFLRHRSGPVYLWYEIAHNRFLRKTVDQFGQPNFTTADIVVDDYKELEWRLRALAGLRNTIGKKIITVGGASGWGAGGAKAPEIAQKFWKMELIDVPYPVLGERIKKALQNTALVENCKKLAESYLKQKTVSLHTKREFVHNAFILTEVFKQLLAEAQTDTITINLCMGTIMSMSQTTACLPLSLLNDSDLLAFCESDFVVIPSGILLHYISGLPVFLNDPTYPHNGIVTLAHCTAPRKMDGKRPEPAKILTHFESDYGAAPKVEMKIGQLITNLIPDFDNKVWCGFLGTIDSNPFLDICRSQIDVKVHADCDRLNQETKGFHWMTAYGNWLKECEYALKKAGVDFINLSKDIKFA
ncbi:MAG: sugar isomerase [Verrucomicrobiia bacterium]